MKKLIPVLIVFVSLVSVNTIDAQQFESIKDTRDGQIYKTVKIGAQLWMAENLRFESKSGFSWFEEAPQYKKVFGCYYRFDVAHAVCPKGWHLPTDKEWLTLANFLGGVYTAGAKLKTKDTWMPPNTGADNSTGFTALPTGFQDLDGTFTMQGSVGYFWSSDENQLGNGSMWLVASDAPVLRNADYDKKSGLNVRCIKDRPKTK